MIAAISRKKRNTHWTGFTNDNENDNFWHQKWSVWDTALFFPFPLPFLSFSCLFLYSSFSFFPFCCPFSFPFSFAFWFPFLFLSLFFPFLFLSFSFPFPFPLPFLFCPFPSFAIPFPFPFPRSCEFFDQGVKPPLGKTIRGKKNDNVWKNHLKGLGVFTTPHIESYRYI